jgi:hypothetical protein
MRTLIAVAALIIGVSKTPTNPVGKRTGFLNNPVCPTRGIENPASSNFRTSGSWSDAGCG